MSVLESLRKRSGLVVAIVGLALLAFVLTGLLEKGSSMFGSGNVIGEIAGKSIDYNAFKAKVDEAVENQKRNSGKSTLNAEETDGVVQQVWNQMINQEILNKEFDELGITVSDEELYDLMVDHPHPALVRNLSDQQGKISPMFADEKTGQISPAKLKQFTQSMTDEQERSWAELENYIRQVRLVEKYNNLIKKGMYVTTSAAKRDFIGQNTNANIKYIIKNYKLVADSTIKPSDEELSQYWSSHQNDFKQEASRKLEYVAFDVVPSADDIAEAKKEMDGVATDFKAKKADEDSAYVISESASRFFDMSFHTPGTLGPQIDTIMFKADVGTVVGPYEENGAFIIAKLIAVKQSADSAHVRHILISYKGAGASQTVTRTKPEAKKLADSLLAVVKKGGKFADLVEKYSDDGGKKMPPNKKEGEDYKGKGGDYGWLNANSSFVEPFKNAALDNKKGDFVIVESQFGYHIMEILDSKGSQKKVQVATIDRQVEASSKTMQAIFVQASTFAGNNTTEEQFEKSVIDQKLNKRIADNIKENDKTIAGIDSPRSLVKWAYDSKKGTVSEPMEFGDKFIVAVLTEVREKGIAPLEQVKDEVTAKVIQQKKAEQFSKELEEAMAGGVSIEALSEKTKLAMEQAQAVNMGTNAIPGSQSEPAVVGTVCGMKAKTMSKPITGKEGVFVVYVDAVTDAPAQKDYKGQQTALENQMQPRVDYEVYDALKDKANVVDHLVKFGY